MRRVLDAARGVLDGALGLVVLAAFGAALWSAASAPSAEPLAWALAWVRAGSPLVAALVAGAWLGAACAGELATLRRDGQLDAIEAMGGGTLRHLVAPRVLGAGLALVLLALVADAVGLAIAWVRAGLADGASGPAALTSADVAAGLARALAFGIAAAAVGCAAGLRRVARAPAPPPARLAAAAAGAAVVWIAALHVVLGGAGLP